MKKTKIIIYVAVLMVVAALIYWHHVRNTEKDEIKFETAPVKRGTISTTITATGTVEPLKQINVGTQVSGVIKKIYVDFNSRVKQGQILAVLDKTPLLEQLASAKADLENAQSQYTYQRDNYNRIKQLYDSSAVSETDYENAEYQYNVSKANVDKMKTGVERAQTSLDYATIYSPINGVVLDRAVDEGQTVAASFNTPTLFTIAQDLTKMQVEADVDEADIGQVKDGQEVVFTVDAFPDEVFKGTVSQVRLKPIVNSNVVTYTVIIDAPNPELKLKPGLTASITDYTNIHKDVLYIPAGALRFRPDSLILSRYLLSSFRDRYRNRSGSNRNSGFKNRGTNGSGEEAPSDSISPALVWLAVNDSIRPARIMTGLTDDINVEVKSGLHIGDKVVLSIERPGKVTGYTAESAPRSPFMPQRPKRQR